MKSTKKIFRSPLLVFLLVITSSALAQELHLTCVGTYETTMHNEFILPKNGKTKSEQTSRFYRFKNGQLSETDSFPGDSIEPYFGHCIWSTEKIICSPKNNPASYAVPAGCRFVGESAIMCENKIEISRTSGIVREIHHQNLEYRQIGNVLRIDGYRGVCRAAKSLF